MYSYNSCKNKKIKNYQYYTIYFLLYIAFILFHYYFLLLFYYFYSILFHSVLFYYLYSLETLLHIHNATVDEWKLLEEFEQDIARQKIESEVLIYIAGYVAHRFRFSFCHLGQPSAKLQSLDEHHWLSCLSRGNCIYSSGTLFSSLP